MSEIKTIDDLIDLLSDLSRNAANRSNNTTRAAELNFFDGKYIAYLDAKQELKKFKDNMEEQQLCVCGRSQMSHQDILNEFSQNPTPTNESWGHGHVIPRPDGALARCGGPVICSVCAFELARKSKEKPND